MYEYDTVGNLIYETYQNGNKFVDYTYNALNQLTWKTSDNNKKEYYTYEYDKAGNLLNEIYHKNNKTEIVGAYTYDGLNRLDTGTNDIGEKSAYNYNGLGYLVQNTWTIKKNAYGYHDVQPNEVVAGEVVIDQNTGEKDAKSKKTKEAVLASPTLNKTSTVIKDFLPDYTRSNHEVLFETEDNGLTYRYGLGKENKLSVKVSPIDGGAGSISENGAILAYYHTDYLGTVDYLTSDNAKRVISWTMYDEWGEITHNAVLKCGQRELDLVKNYTGHEYDSVLDLYYAKNRMYDADNRSFTQKDPARDGYNWYAYTGNNPINYTDPLGLYFIRYYENKNSYEIFPYTKKNVGFDAVLALVPAGDIFQWQVQQRMGATYSDTAPDYQDVIEALGSITFTTLIELVKNPKVYKLLSKGNFTLSLFLAGVEIPSNMDKAEVDGIAFGLLNANDIMKTSSDPDKLKRLMDQTLEYVLVSNKWYFVDRVEESCQYALQLKCGNNVLPQGTLTHYLFTGTTLHKMDAAMELTPKKTKENMKSTLSAWGENLRTNQSISLNKMGLIEPVNATSFEGMFDVFMDGWKSRREKMIKTVFSERMQTHGFK